MILYRKKALWVCSKEARDNKIVDGEMMIEKSTGEVLGLKRDYSC